MDTKIDMELLAPAGGFDQMKAAIRFGADAVYLATDRFGMRAKAANFTLDELPAAVAYAHDRGVSVHVACNILMNPSDADQLPDYFRALEAAGVDALIIADLGAFMLARQHAPGLELHVSTQASVANAQAATAWHALGARRVVCAREMSLADIARMRQETPSDLQIEAFVHGAMCMAVSGRCIISSYLTGRSANKGECTQPCRWSYRLEEEKRPGMYFPVEEDERGTHIFNAQDMCMISHLRELKTAGVDSIKIEGRNKKSFYVASVVGAYRRVLDGAPPEEVMPELEAIAHRPYGTGFYFGVAIQAPRERNNIQEFRHVGDVLACDPDGDVFTLTVRCRNRFAQGDEIEILAPGVGGRKTVVENLLRIADETGAPLEDGPVCESVANRACNVYAFASPEPFEPGSYLRLRENEPAGE